ncbi:DegT/DnrJ/EryC1/StrS aminotransferase family protein [Nordella sp. HKS 07]|uniref:DegT/DnrJ/EryC1/StrS family aminotransferase n=1 Tax=Nordella sp. HKS 07 TaxID=2712222 RepID=UPI0013E1A62C|nr:DegT/DnrJ/EryC1/StrS family aminotransferase [Nordella sp. HKS 07]QIG51348.1 DegT/DnrJ/EryC1/StrS aminotransferase family protein [Nordella sp. HKS 07]
MASNRRPVLASVSADTGLPDDATLASAIDANRSQPGLLVLTHLYGKLADYPGARAMADQRGWVLLENDSLAATAGSPRECAPRTTRLLSFGSGKTVDGGGGGAILTNDARLADTLSTRASAWPVFDHAADQTEDHIVLARRHLSAIGLAWASEPLFAVEVAQCRHSFDPNLAEPILAALHRFPESNARRLARLAMWNEVLADVSHAISAPPVPISAAWRGLFRVQNEELRDRIVIAMREAGHDAGTNYPPLWDVAPTLVGDQRDTRGDAWGQTVVTLWLTDTYDQNRIRSAADVIKRTIGG